MIKTLVLNVGPLWPTSQLLVALVALNPSHLAHNLSHLGHKRPQLSLSTRLGLLQLSFQLAGPD